MLHFPLTVCCCKLHSCSVECKKRFTFPFFRDINEDVKSSVKLPLKLSCCCPTALQMYVFLPLSVSAFTTGPTDGATGHGGQDLHGGWGPALLYHGVCLPSIILPFIFSLSPLPFSIALSRLGQVGHIIWAIKKKHEKHMKKYCICQ